MAFGTSKLLSLLVYHCPSYAAILKGGVPVGKTATLLLPLLVARTYALCGFNEAF
jgi:hypothetical protein